MICDVRQNYEGKFYYQILGDTVGPFDTENKARDEGVAALKLVEGQKPTTNTDSNKICHSCNGKGEYLGDIGDGILTCGLCRATGKLHT